MKKFNKYKKRIKIFKKKVSLVRRNTKITKYSNDSHVNNDLILIESKNGKDLGSNIFYIIKELSDEKYDNFKLVLSLKKDKFDKIRKILSNYGINNLEFVETGSIDYYKYLFTAKYLFNDTSFPNSFIKKDSQIYLNTWHGTPLKKLGREVPKRAYALGNVQKNFIISDYLLYPNHFMEKHMIESFMLENISKAKIMNAGYPRNSIFFENSENNKLKQKLGLGNSKIIVYMPTWRGRVTKIDMKSQIDQITGYLSEIDKLLDKNQIFYVKLHPFVTNDINYDDYENIKPFPENYETYDILNISDCLVTDYSSVFFDYASSKKKIILFTYDEEEYCQNHGLYMDLKELPFPKVYNTKDLIKEINSEKNYNDGEFISKFCTYDGANAARDICEYIIFNKNSENISIKDIPKDKKENVLIYSGNLAKNGMTTSLLSLLENIDLNERNYYLSFRSARTRLHSLTLFNITRKVGYIPIVGENNFNLMEAIAFIFFNKFNVSNSFINKYLDRGYKRNLKRYFSDVEFDSVIHFTGYEKNITALFQRFKSKKIIFAHNDMVNEIKTKGNQHYLTLHEAYNSYDKIAVVSNDIKKPVTRIKGDSKNIMVVENFINKKTILRKSKEKLSFDENTLSNMDLENLKEVLDSDSLKFVTIGRFSHEKGHIRLLNVFNEFYKKNKDSYLIIIGGYGKLYRKTLNHSKTLECSENVIIIRSLSNPFPILKNCDLFILGSYYEGLGLVLLEADILGVKSFSTRVRGPTSFMEKYEGHLVENSEEGIYKGMEDFMENKISLLNINYEKYNEKIINHFESLFDDS